MKKAIAIFVVAAAGLTAAQTQQTTSKKKTTKTVVAKKPAAPVAQPLTIPKDAVANADGTYSYTDKQGKKWIYSKTPFGVSKIADMGPGGAPAFNATPKEQLIHATDSGDTVKFQRQTPFGTTKWEKKKSELTDEERRIFENQQAKQQSPETKPE
ncbi:MAG TPA: hypothetical protein VHB50_11765 [Bryobacteraceae bacterium]|nr:hypothetical protein [Bryobacteraceae bacterium]